MPKYLFVRQCPGCQYLVPPAWERCKRCDADLACARTRSLVGAGAKATNPSAPATFGAARFAGSGVAPPASPVAPPVRVTTPPAFAPSAPNDVRGGYERVPTVGESWASIHQAPKPTKLPILGVLTTIAIVVAGWFAWHQATARNLPAEWRAYVEAGEGVDYQSVAGRFSVKFPTEPVEMGQSVIVGGRRFEVVALMSAPDGKAQSGVGVLWIDLPSDMLATNDTNALLQQYAEEWAERGDGSVSELDFLTVERYQAVDASIKEGVVRGKARIILAGTRVYVLVAAGTENGAIGFGTLTESFDLT